MIVLKLFKENFLGRKQTKGKSKLHVCTMHWRGGLIVSALVSGSSGPGSSPGRGHCVVFLGKTLL